MYYSINFTFLYCLQGDYEHMDEQRFRQQLEARNKKQQKVEKRSGEWETVNIMYIQLIIYYWYGYGLEE